MSCEWAIPKGKFNNKDEYQKACNKILFEMLPKVYHFIPYEMYKMFMGINKI